jgi:hypothetical protein
MKTIWDLKRGQRFKTKTGTLFEVIEPTQDGEGLVGKYLDGESVGQDDFILEHEIEFSEDPTAY